MLKKLRVIVFFPPFILLLAAIVLNFVNEDMLITTFTLLNNVFMEKLGWLATLVGFACLLLLIITAFSKFGKVTLGGKTAKPTLSTFNWFALVLTGTIASGILIWGFAEPVYHMMDPATALTGIEPMSNEAELFAMETMYMHWSFIPYALYTVPAVVFGYMLYNAKAKYSSASQLAPMLGRANTPLVADIIDALLMFCIGVSMAACFGQGLVNLVGCSASLFGTEINNFWLLIFTIIIAIIAIGSAISGVQKGMKLCSQVNVWGYVFMFGAILLLGPTGYILGISTESFGGFLFHFLERAMWTGTVVDSNWPQSWTTFYWASWMAWGPTTGIFIASVSYGRKIRDVILLTVGGCASVGIIMTSITAGSTIYTQVNGIEDLVTAVNEYGIGAVPYAVLETLAGSKIIIAVIFVVIILTLVTAVNSNIIAMSGLSCKEANNKDGSDITPWYVKLAWGVVVAMMAYIAMARFGGYDGIKTLSNIGGILALFLILGMCVSLGILIVKYKKFDVLHEDGEEDEPLPAPAEAAETRTEV